MKGYEKTKKAAKGTPLKIFLGMEITFDVKRGTDFLVYGITEEFLYKHKYLYELNYKDFYELIKKNDMLMFQAHPYRNASTPMMPVHYDGIEIINTNTTQDSKNKLAIEFALNNKILIISGSDIHREADCARAGIMLPEGLETSKDVVNYIKENGSPELIVTFKA